MKGLRKIISFMLILTFVFSINITNDETVTDVSAATKFAITSPTNNKMMAAGYFDIKWNSASSYGVVKEYKLYVDGKLETTTTKTTYEFYTTKVNIHSAWVEAILKNGSRIYTDTIKFKVSKKGVGISTDMGKHISPNEINTSWYYNWGTSKFKPLSEDSKGIEFANEFNNTEYVPMVWKAFSYQDAANKVATAKSLGSKYVLGYNEPDLKGQADMTVANGVSFWPAFMNQGLRVGSPATATWPTKNTKWFQPFMTQIQAKGNDVDFITIHCYPDGFPGGPGMATWFINDVVKPCYEKYHKPIWITEFSTTGKGVTNTNTMTFIQSVLPMLDELSYVERYAFFSFNAKDNQAGLWYYSTGALTKAGEAYRDYGNPTKEYKAGNLTNPHKNVIKSVVKKPSKATVKRLQNLKGKKIKVTIKKMSNVAGYQIRIAENKKFNGYWGKTTTKTTYTFRGLDKNTRYYVKVRAYRKNGSKKLYGAWSNPKKIKVKK